VNRIWAKPFVALILFSAFALLLWPIVGATKALACYSALLLVLIVYHFLNISVFYRWLLDPRLETLPNGNGTWEYITSNLQRLLKRQRSSEAALSEALAQLKLASAAIPEAIVLLNESDRIEWCNPRAESDLGLHVASDTGQQITNLMRQPGFVDYLERRDFSEPIVIRSQTERGEAAFSVQIVPYGEREKLLMARDITAWERMETMRRDFVANVSHELRTPLTVVSGFLETLADLDGADPEMTRRSLYLMSQQTQRMTRLVEDLLTLSRLESTYNPPREDAVDIPDLARSLYQDALSLSSGRHQISLEIETGTWIRGSGDEFRSALGNLVSNAVRYTPDRGLIEIRWAMKEGLPVFSVRDSGIGIESQHINRLTERFYRVDRSRSRETGGTGLGLAIVKHVLMRHQAKLRIDSEPGKGSLFSAIFPADRMVEQSADHDAQAA
jgi:two-component system phosphate regulon sensor histidine kinase PhoR